MATWILDHLGYWTSITFLGASLKWHSSRKIDGRSCYFQYPYLELNLIIWLVSVFNNLRTRQVETCPKRLKWFLKRQNCFLLRQQLSLTAESENKKSKQRFWHLDLSFDFWRNGLPLNLCRNFSEWFSYPNIYACKIVMCEIKGLKFSWSEIIEEQHDIKKSRYWNWW